jgi:hypothetical protein
MGPGRRRDDNFFLRGEYQSTAIARVALPKPNNFTHKKRCHPGEGRDDN